MNNCAFLTGGASGQAGSLTLSQLAAFPGFTGRVTAPVSAGLFF